MTIKNYIEVDNKKYSYFIEIVDSEVSKIICKSAKIEQEFLNEDLVGLLKDLPNLIKSEKEHKEHKEKKEDFVRFRVSKKEKILLQEKAKNSGFKTLSAFIKNKILA
ncbi:MAG: hypothetical protein Q9M94_03665 [Candidatus Gracilibacteria bacterium]|nr:hypothetical protein [Candidatus Gracilibacteria bacterium]